MAGSTMIRLACNGYHPNASWTCFQGKLCNEDDSYHAFVERAALE
jgi:hypothetical protein